MILIPEQDITVISSNVPAGTNRDAMFGGVLNAQTVYPDLIEVEIAFNNMDRCALFNIDAVSVDFVLTDNSTALVVMEKHIDLAISGGEYLQWIVESIYIYPDATLHISINNPGKDAKCGKCGAGLSTDIGRVLFGVSPGFLDYSIKDINEFGQSYLKEGAWAKKQEVQCIIPFAGIDNVFDDLTGIRGKMAFWEGNETDTSFESLRAYAFVEDWRIRTKNDTPSEALVDFTLRGAI